MPQYKLKFSDDANTTLATGITAASPSLQVVSGGGALFPTLASQQAMVGTLIKAGSPLIKEIVLVTGHTAASDNFTGLARNYSGTGALTWQAGDIFALLQPAEAMAAFAQILDIQSQQPNYAADTGSANAYAVNLTPTLNASVVGMPIRWKAAHANTGASTFTDGINTGPLVTADLSSLSPGNVSTGGIYESIWDGAHFILHGNLFNFSQLVGSIAAGQVPSSVVLQWESIFAIAFSQLTGQLQNGQIASSIGLPGSPTTTTQAVGTSNTQLATTGFVNPGSSLGGSYKYRKNPDGSIDQWGSTAVSGTTTITFPTTFPTSCDSFVLTNMNSTNQIYEQSKSAANAVVTNGTATVDWQAKGH